MPKSSKYHRREPHGARLLENSYVSSKDAKILIRSNCAQAIHETFRVNIKRIFFSIKVVDDSFCPTRLLMPESRKKRPEVSDSDSKDQGGDCEAYSYPPLLYKENLSTYDPMVSAVAFENDQVQKETLVVFP